jgi:hypothetical protein
MGFSSGANFEKLVHELKDGVLGQTIGFAATVSEKAEELATKRLFFSTERKAYRRLFSIGPPKSDATLINQMVLFVGSFSFFWHAIDRLSFRTNNDALRAAILDPVAVALSKMLSEVLSNQGTKTTTGEVLASVQPLSLRYAGAPSLLGTNEKDETCALGLAARAIAGDADLARTEAERYVLTTIVRTQLMESLISLDLTNRIKTLEALL